MLPPFLKRHPEYSFFVETVPSVSEVVHACRQGEAHLGFYRGILPLDGLQAYPYQRETIAAIVVFTKPLEKVDGETLRRAIEGDAASRSDLDISTVLVWDKAGLEELGCKVNDAQVAPVIDLAARVREDQQLLGLLPYANVSPAVRVLRIDGLHPSETGYPLVRHEAVLSNASSEILALAQDLASELGKEAGPEAKNVLIACVGDMMLARDMGQAIRQYGSDYPFRDVRHMLADADLTIGNLECVISERGEPEPKAYTFRAPLTATQSLREAGFDLLNVANNHTLDFGPLALADTFAALEDASIRYVGAGRNEAAAHAPVFIEVKGIRIAFLGYARYPTEISTGFPPEAFIAVGEKPGIAWADVERIRAEVADAKRQADLVVVALHAGREYWEVPDDFQRDAAHAAIEAGAAFVWGHHAHSWQGIEFYQQGVILYSLGDFVFDQMTTNDTAIARLWLSRQGVCQLELWPVVIVENGRPTPADEAKGRAILDWLYRLSEELQTR